MAASFIGGVPVTLNGTTWVAVVTAPGANKQRQILSVAPYNADSAETPHGYEGRFVKNAVNYPRCSTAPVTPGKAGELVAPGSVVLAATDESFEVRQTEATKTTQSVCFVAIFEVP